MGQLCPGRARPSSQVMTVPKTVPKGICLLQVAQDLVLGQAVLEESWSALCRWPPMADPGLSSSCRVVSASIYCSLSESPGNSRDCIYFSQAPHDTVDHPLDRCQTCRPRQKAPTQTHTLIGGGPPDPRPCVPVTAQQRPMATGRQLCLLDMGEKNIHVHSVSYFHPPVMCA